MGKGRGNRTTRDIDRDFKRARALLERFDGNLKLAQEYARHQLPQVMHVLPEAKWRWDVEHSKKPLATDPPTLTDVS